MKKFISVFILSLLVFQINAQSTTPKYVAEAIKSYESGKYAEALPLLEAAYNKMTSKGKSISEKGKMAFMVGECYRHLERYDKAAQWYGSSVELKYYEVEPKVYYYQGEMLRMAGNFKKAEECYKAYDSRRGKDKSINIEGLLKSCNMNSDFHAEESNYVVKFEDDLNDKKCFDMAPSISDKKEMQIIFSTQREDIVNTARDPITGEKYMDLWVAEFNEKGNWTSSKSLDNAGLVNTNSNEGTAVFDRKGRVMYFTRCPAVNKQNLGCSIWMADRVDDGFENVQQINIDKKGDSISVGHPCITADGMMLIFASNMPGGIGGKDLWYITYNKKLKAWDTIPKNMGPTINTAGNELFPSLSFNDSLFFFASDGHPGIGGLDIFKAVISKDKLADGAYVWKGVKNMMKPINSSANDYGLTIRKDLKSGFFTSERSSEKSKTYTPDIYSFSTPPVSFDLQVIVYEHGNRNKKIDGARVEVKEINGQKWEELTNAKGKTSKWTERKDNKTNPRYINPGFDYSITATKARYFPMARPTRITTKDTAGNALEKSQSFVVEIPLIPIELRTPEIRYHLDKWTFVNDNTISSKDSLKFLVDLLKDNPDIIINLYSHTDSRASVEHNQALSENRAKAVYKYLVGVDASFACRIFPFGMGESKPAKYIDEKGEEHLLTDDYINQFKGDKFEALHQINRRTTVTIVTEEGSDMPKIYDPSVPCTPDPAFSKYIEPLPR